MSTGWRCDVREWMVRCARVMSTRSSIPLLVVRVIELKVRPAHAPTSRGQSKRPYGAYLPHASKFITKTDWARVYPTTTRARRAAPDLDPGTTGLAWSTGPAGRTVLEM
jgi:hypothetical protein